MSILSLFRKKAKAPSEEKAGGEVLSGDDRTYKLYDTRAFYDTYKAGLIKASCGEDVFMRHLDATISGKHQIKVYDDEMSEIVEAQKAHDLFNQKLSTAARLNNEGATLEKSGDIPGAIGVYEQNILPDTYFTLHPYKRLCILYRKSGDYENEIRVIKTCLGRPEWSTKQYSLSTERFFYEDRLTKAMDYLAKKNK